MAERDEVLDRVVETLREPVRIDPALDERVMAAIRAQPRLEVTEGGRRIGWLRRPMTVTMSPIGAAAAVLVIALAGGIGGRWLGSSGAGTPAATTAAAPGESTIEFVLVAPAAGSVSLVGDFNDWDLAATPLERADGDAVWSVTVPLEPGRYRYAFLVDGTVWRQDPNRAPALDDEFGRPNSVVTVGGA